MPPTTDAQWLSPNLRTALRSLLVGRVCIVGVGNRARGDDGAGPRLIDQRRPATVGVWIDAGVTPENYLELIVRTHPGTVLVVDAVDFGEIPGACRLLNPTNMARLVLSTHAGSLEIIAEYLSARTDCKLRVLGIQPQTIDFQQHLSAPVARCVRELAVILSDLLPASIGVNADVR